MTEAVHDTVHDFGVEELARLTGQSPAVIYNKVNPNGTTPHLPTLADALVWQALTKDFRILHAMSQALAHVSIPLPDLTRVSDQALLEIICRACKEGGDFYAAIEHALKDRKVRADEVAKVDTEAYEFIAAVLEAASRMRGMVDS